MRLLLILIALFFHFVFADQYSERLRDYQTRRAAQQEQVAYASTVTQINSQNEKMLSRVLQAAHLRGGSPDNLRCYSRGVIQAEHFYGTSRDSSETRTWTSARGYEIPVGVPRGANIPLTVVGTAVMMPFMLPHTIGSLARSAQAPVYPPQIGACSFEVQSLACTVYPAIVRCVDPSGANVTERKQ